MEVPAVLSVHATKAAPARRALANAAVKRRTSGGRSIAAVSRRRDRAASPPNRAGSGERRSHPADQIADSQRAAADDRAAGFQFYCNDVGDRRLLLS